MSQGTNHGGRSHARYSSSRIHRVRACAGYVAFSVGFARAENEAAEEGTEAHEALAAQLSAWGDYGQKPPSADIKRAVDMVLDYIEGVCIAHPGQIVLTSEEPVTFPQSVVPAEDVQGIPDVMLHDASEQEAWAIEFKYGHVFVSEKRNPQLLFNSVAKWWNTPIKRLNLVVIQPNCFQGEHVRVDTVGPVEMAEFQMETEAAIAAAEQPDAPLTAGPHCRWCERELTCPVRERMALAVVEPMASRVEQLDGLKLPDIPAMPLDRLAYVLRHADELRSWLNAAEKHAWEQAIQGMHVPEHKLVEALARRQFPDDVDATAARLSALTSGAIEPHDFTERKLLGVIKIETILANWAAQQAPKGAQRAWIKDMKDRLAFLTPRQSTGNLSLVHISDSRPAALTKIAAGFAGVNIPPPPP